MKSIKAVKKYRITAEQALQLRTARIGQQIRINRDTVVTVLASPDSVRACYKCIFFSEFTHSDVDRCPKARLCYARARRDKKSVYFRIFNER